MNSNLTSLLKQFQSLEEVDPAQKEEMLSLLKKLQKDVEILEFKLDRTEKVKQTTAVLLEETIEELQRKSKAVEDVNQALRNSLDELKNTQNQLVHSEKMAALGELTAGIAHEIQNPLNFVNNFSEINQELVSELIELINQQDWDEVKLVVKDIAENEEKIKHHGRRAENIVKSMLQHSRKSTGVAEVFDLNQLIDEYFRLAYHGMRAKDKSFQVRMTMKLDESLPSINAVKQDVGRVVLNLITNAFHAIAERVQLGEDHYVPFVEVRTKDMGEGIRVQVIDNGSGMTDEIKDKIFQPFYTTKPAGQGTGLGLSISHDIIKAHRGQIEVNSQVGQGTTFTFIIPKNKN